MSRARPFEVPSDEEMTQAFGSAPVLLDPDGLKSLSIDDAITGDRVELTYEAVTSSVRCRWSRRGAPFVDIYREGITEMRIAGARRDMLEALFDVGGATGTLSLRLVPPFAVHDATAGA